MNRFKKILVVATIFSLFTGIISAEAASKPLVVVKSSSSAKTSTHSKSAGLTKSTFDYAGAVSLTSTTASVYLDLKHGLTQNGCYTFGVSAFKQTGKAISVFPGYVSTHYNGCEQVKSHKLLPFTVNAKLGDVLTLTSGKEVLKVTVGSTPIYVAPKPVPTPTIKPTPTPTKPPVLAPANKASFDYASATVVDTEHASVVIDLQKGSNENSCYSFGTKGFTQVVNLKGVITITVSPIVTQTASDSICLAKSGHTLIPFIVKALYGQQLIVTDGKTHKYATVKHAPKVTPIPIPTPTVSATPTPTNTGTPGLDSNTTFNYIDIQAINNTQAWLYLDRKGVNPSGCWTMSEDHHTQAGLNVSVVLLFTLNSTIPNCSSSKEHTVFPITIDAKAGDKVTVDSGTTTMSAVVKPVYVVPTPSFGPPINILDNPLPTIKTSTGADGIDLIALEKIIYAKAKEFKYAGNSSEATIYCSDLTTNYSAWLLLYANQNKYSDCTSYVIGFKGTVASADSYDKLVSDKKGSFLYDGSGSVPTAYIKLANAFSEGTLYDSFRLELISGKWLVDSVQWERTT
jgi:hypothetical protein